MRSGRTPTGNLELSSLHFECHQPWYIHVQVEMIADCQHTLDDPLTQGRWLEGCEGDKGMGIGQQAATVAMLLVYTCLQHMRRQGHLNMTSQAWM